MNQQKTIYVHIPYPILLEKFPLIVKDRINPEIYVDISHLDGGSPDVFKDIKKRLDEAGLSLTLHGPYADINPGSANENERLYAVRQYEKTFEAAGILLPKTIVLHAGYSDKKFKGDKDLYLAQSLKTWPLFVEMARRINTVIVVENIFEKTPDTLRSLVEAVDSPNLRICIDTGHLNIYSQTTMEEWVSELGPYLGEVHLHDNSGKNDEHLPMGMGTVDFRLFFSLLKKYANEFVYTIEPHGEEVVKAGLEAARRFVG